MAPQGGATTKITNQVITSDYKAPQDGATTFTMEPNLVEFLPMTFLQEQHLMQEGLNHP